MATIDLKDISLFYGNNGTTHKALLDVNLNIEDGEFVSLIGPSGCGKSTIIDVVSGLKSPTKGSVMVNGSPVKGPGTDRGVVFQDYSLFPWMTTFENISFAIEHTKKAKDHRSIDEKAHKFLKLVGLEKFKDAYPNNLSGGMRQRAAIARMFSIDPKVFVMDEPFGALDSFNRSNMQDLLLQLWSKGEQQKTVLFVTHDVDEALLLSDRIAVMTPSPGKIHEIIDVPFPRPRHRKTLSVNSDYNSMKAYLLSILHGGTSEDADNQENQIKGS